MAAIKEIKKKGKDNTEIRISVEEIENGFLICKTTEGRDAKDNWKYETKKFFSETNPFDKAEKSLAESFK